MSFPEPVLVTRFKILQYPSHVSKRVVVQASDDLQGWEDIWTQDLHPKGHYAKGGAPMRNFVQYFPLTPVSTGEARLPSHTGA